MQCRVCNCQSASIYKCGNCNVALYCSVSCQASDWSTHVNKCNTNLHAVSLANTESFVLLYADSCVELAVESLAPNVVLGPETHENSTQIIRVESGSARFRIGAYTNTTELLTEGSIVIIPANTPHTVMAGVDGIKFSTTYSPPRVSNQ
jgi:mannose-6-phosphate isomerase-like protein (cupin superfamily)